MKAVIIINIMAFFIAGNSDNIINNNIRTDNALVAPGIGAENIILKQSADDVISIKGYPDKISYTEGKAELFRDIFKVLSPVKITFDKIFYYSIRKEIFFINSDQVCAIAGLDTQRVTIDSVDLNKGAEYFIFSYGNRNLEILKKDDAKDIVYLYSNGIALVDDRADDKIDMYVVFPPYQQ